MPKIIMQCKVCGKEIQNEETRSHLKEHDPSNYYIPVMKITWDELLGKEIKETKKTKKHVEEEPEEEVEEIEEEEVEEE